MSLRFDAANTSIKLHNHNVKCLTLSPTDDQLFFLCGDSFCCWDLESETYETLVEKLPRHMDFLAVLPDASRILLVDRSGLYLFDPDRSGVAFCGELSLPPEDAVSCFTISPDARYAVVCSYRRVGLHVHSDVRLRIWDLSRRQPIIELPGHENPVTDALFTPDGSRLITCSRMVGDHGIFEYESPRYRLWSVSDGVCIDSFGGEKGSRFGETHSEPWDRFSSVCMDISPDGKLGIFAVESRVALVDLSTWRTVQRFDTGAERLELATFSSDGAHVFALGDNQVFYSWNRATGEVERLVGGYSDYAREFVVTSNNDSFITTHSDGGYGTWIYRRALFPNDVA